MAKFWARRALVATLIFLAPVAARALAPAGPLALPEAVAKPGQVVVKGRSIDYTAEAAEYLAPAPDGQPGATIFYTSYVAKGSGGAPRPVVFLFNGGPGGPTTGLRQTFSPVMHTVAPPDHKTVSGAIFAPNPNSVLDVADLVFIDPPGTGYSRILPGAKGADFWGNLEDARAISGFIAEWLKRHGRLASPTYIVGESYGGLRAVLAADLLGQGTAPVWADGVVLISPSTEFGGVGGPARDQSFIDALPSEAAVASFHGRGVNAKRPMTEVVDQAERFAQGDYATALAKGDAIDPETFERTLQREADLTGLPPAFIREHKLRVSTKDFVQTLLADQEERTGLLDGRAHALKSKMNGQKPPWDDPSTEHNSLAYDANLAWAEYFEQTLGYRPVASFLWLNFDANKNWVKSRPAGDYAGAPEEMRAVMEREPNLRVLQVGGLFDLTLPYHIARRRYGGANLPASRLVQKTYPTGHAIFADKRSQDTSIDDLRRFIAHQPLEKTGPD